MQKLYIIDASGYLYRSYHAIRQMTNRKGESTNAVFGFIRCMLKLIKEFRPTHLVSVFDGPNNASKRCALYPEYKANRKAMPPDLMHQILWAEEFCRLIGIPLLTIPDVEADDTMGSVAVWASSQETLSYLCTSDKDMCQLVSDRVFILNTFKDNLIVDRSEVEKQFGVFPEQMIDFLAITGDASDNIPGLTGFGSKTAAALLKQHGTLDYILENPKEIAGAKKQQILKAEREKVLLSRRLVTIDTGVPFPESSDFFLIKPAQRALLREFYENLNFSSLLKEMNQDDPDLPDSKPAETVSYRLVESEAEIRDLVLLLSDQKEVCIDTETTDIHPLRAKLTGIGLGIVSGQAWYIPFNAGLDPALLVQILKPLLENPTVGFYGHNLKYDYHVLLNYGIRLSRICFDTILASYLLNSHARKHSLDHLSLEIFGKTKIPIQDLIGKGQNQTTMNEVPVPKVCEYCCEDVDYTIRLKDRLSPELKKRNLNELLENLELPLLPVLAKMERRGIFVDILRLQDLGKELSPALEQAANAIHEMAGETFNINSPKQLGHILFEKLCIPPPKKTATGFSTNAEVLESLIGKHPIAEKILEYRSLEKLRSTYVEALPSQIHPQTQRIHCTFNQTGAATGRLSCQDPNLQNIPVRTEAGRKIREAFRPELPGWSYISADYSQIELRILAHLSEDPVLTEAFASNRDIHRFTASQMFNIPLYEVTEEQRYQAKAVNFGIMYGQQAFGLAQELKIDPKTASLFIQKYFERYRKVKEFIESCKSVARETGRATTLFGRERLIPEIRSENAFIRSPAERLAVNTPIQGTQADLIKMGMLEVDKRLTDRQFRGYMILQIHDELIFEVPDEEIEAVSRLVHSTMEGIYTLKVPLTVNIHVGKNWKEC